jgi:hypothetical protein
MAAAASAEAEAADAGKSVRDRKAIFSMEIENPGAAADRNAAAPVLF